MLTHREELPGLEIDEVLPVFDLLTSLLREHPQSHACNKAGIDAHLSLVTYCLAINNPPCGPI